LSDITKFIEKREKKVLFFIVSWSCGRGIKLWKIFDLGRERTMNSINGKITRESLLTYELQSWVIFNYSTYCQTLQTQLMIHLASIAKALVCISVLILWIHSSLTFVYKENLRQAANCPHCAMQQILYT
jgi:hypothetical protein